MPSPTTYRVKPFTVVAFSLSICSTVCLSFLTNAWLSSETSLRNFCTEPSTRRATISLDCAALPAATAAAALAAGKAAQSPEIVAKRVEGSVQKFLKEVSLLNQSFVKNDKQTVEQMLKAAGTTVKAFTMFIVGEGIEKKTDDFAAEVAAQVAAAKAQ